MRVAAFDLGSYSFHLLVADAHPDGAVEPVVTDKETLLLGMAVAATGELGPAGAEAAVRVVRRFSAIAESLRCDQVVATATAAFRRARDADAVVGRIAAETGVAVRIISGWEEARLTFNAIRKSVVLAPGPALALDLGGGSLEMIVGDAGGMRWARSADLGAARLAAALVRDNPPSAGDRRRVTRAVEHALAPVLPEIAARRPQLAVGSSGTASCLIRLAAAPQRAAFPASVNQVTVTVADLEGVAAALAGMTAAERAALPGVDARRAELLPVGAWVLTTVMRGAGLDRLVGSAWAMREGMVLDAVHHPALAREDHDPTAIRRESVLRLCRRSGWNEEHSTKVARIALDIFDGTRSRHALTSDDRDLLEFGALLHDVGEHVSTAGHERHSAYLIENGRLRGFSPAEIDLLSCLGRYHKRGAPKTSFEPFSRLSGADQRRAAQLVALLQVADVLDRRHGGPVRSVEVSCEAGAVRITVDADDAIDLELWGATQSRDLFQRAFGCRLEVVDARIGSAA